MKKLGGVGMKWSKMKNLKAFLELLKERRRDLRRSIKSLNEDIAYFKKEKQIANYNRYNLKLHKKIGQEEEIHSSVLVLRSILKL